MTIDSAFLEERLLDLCEQHDVPGASAAVLAGGDVVAEAAAGVLSIRTGVEATPESIFQIGSISKAYTATLVMQLVDEGSVDLDAAISTYLPELSLAEDAVVDEVTVRQLLSHTSGIDGDCFADTGRGDDCVERYVDRCATLRMTHRPGETMSYCNTGYVLLGRMVEKLRGATWDAVLKQRLLRPIGAKSACTLPEDAILRRAAVGHIHGPGQEPIATKLWMLPRSMGPAGLISSTAREMLLFAQLHLDGGTTQDGTRVLSEEAVAAMQQPHTTVPDRWSVGDRWGLGWILFDWQGHQLFGHDGSTIGQAAFLRVLPEAGAAVALLTNGGSASRLYRALVSDVFQELAGVRVPPPLAPPAVLPPVDPAVVMGTYERLGVRIDIHDGGDDGELRAVLTHSGDSAALRAEPVQTLQLAAVDELTFLASDGEGGDPAPLVFYDVRDGRARFVHHGVRACRRLD